MHSIIISSECAMLALGKRMAEKLPRGVVFLRGELGAGKTTLARGMLRGYGHAGAVTSPTYTLLEQYELPARDVFHFDLYRMEDAREVEALGVRDALSEAAVLIIEWPERAVELLPQPDVTVNIAHGDSDARRVEISAAHDSPLMESLIKHAKLVSPSPI